MLIPRFIAAYTYHQNNTSEITDAPTIRTIKFILQDEFDDWRDGEMMLQSLITTPDDVRRAADHQARLEAIMVEAGGITGPGASDDASIDTTDRNDPQRHTQHRTRRHLMRQFFPVEDLARDERFVQTNMAERMKDVRSPRVSDRRRRAATACRRRAAPRRPASRPTATTRPTPPAR